MPCRPPRPHPSILSCHGLSDVYVAQYIQQAESVLSRGTTEARKSHWCCRVSHVWGVYGPENLGHQSAESGCLTVERAPFLSQLLFLPFSTQSRAPLGSFPAFLSETVSLFRSQGRLSSLSPAGSLVPSLHPLQRRQPRVCRARSARHTEGGGSSFDPPQTLTPPSKESITNSKTTQAYKENKKRALGNTPPPPKQVQPRHIRSTGLYSSVQNG